jgi:outer membrane protein OmpA-like peptidoglycan-associated protein
MVMAVVLFGVVGCVATRNFVREEMRERDTHIARLDSDLGQERSRVGDIGSQVAGVRTRVDDVSKRADQAAGVGTQALARAQEANAKAGDALAKAEDTDTRFKKLWASRNKRAVADTVIVHFRFNRSDLDDRAQTTLLNAIKMLEENPDALVAVQGFTDPTGPADYNLQLSERRAESVRRFLVQHGVDLHRIQSIGMGEAEAGARTAKTSRPREQDRRVAVHLVMPAE